MRSCIAGLVLLMASPTPAEAIWGGRAAKKSEGKAAAHFTATGHRYRGSCTGVLVARNKVLTAAHCVRTRKGKRLRVRSVRIGNPRARTRWARVASVHVHPDYDPEHPSRGSDFAVLLLRKPVKGVAPLSLASAAEHPRQGVELRIHGFGMIRRGRRLRMSSRRLHVAKVHALSPFACFSGPVKKMALTRMCAASPTAGVCPGDSGAGAVRLVDGKPVVVGIVSVVLDGGRCHRGPVIMGRVSTFAEWVRGVGAAKKG